MLTYCIKYQTFLLIFLIAIAHQLYSLQVYASSSSKKTSCYNDCSGNGVCQAEPRAKGAECRCYSGYHGVDCSLRLCPAGRAWVDYPSTSNVAHGDYTECSNMGECNRKTGKCECRVGFMGPACQQQRCPSGSAPVALQGFGGQIPCSGKGRCLSLRSAMLFADMSRTDSEFFNSSYPNLLLPSNYPTTMSSILTTNSWELDAIQGCVCDPGWGGIDCSKRTCPRGDDPKTAGVSETQLIDCQCSGTAAACADATLTINVRGQVTEKIHGTATDEEIRYRLMKLSTVERVRVSIVQGTTLCSTSGSVTKVTFEIPFVSYPKMIINTYDGFAGTVAVFNQGRASALKNTEFSSKNTRESVECSNHGECDRSTGNCVCYKGFSSSNGLGMPGSRPDCGYYYGNNVALNVYNSVSYSTCPVVNNLVCNNKGTCNEATATCNCNVGYEGAACTRLICPKTTAWFSASPSAWSDLINNHKYKMVCSGVGDCDGNTGKCTNCGGNWGYYEGDSCEYLSCPKTGSGTNLTTCGGHGVCKKMSEMVAWQYTSKGELAGLTYTTPWDANMIKGCVCERSISVDNRFFKSYGNPFASAATFNITNYDTAPLYESDSTSLYFQRSKFYRGPYAEAATDFTGYNCKQMKCPTGDDPNTFSRGNEIQKLTFYKSTGVFQLKFRENSTRPISCNETLTTLHYYLEELYTVRKVDVFRLDLTSSISICQTAYPVYIEFLGNFGDLPLLKPNTLKMGSAAEIAGYGGVEPQNIVVTRFARTDREEIECSGQGICDYSTGICKCRDYYRSSSSRAVGKPGERGDCSFIDKYA